MNEATNAGSGFFKPYTHQVAGHSQLKGKGDVGKLRDSLASQSVHVASKNHSAIGDVNRNLKRLNRSLIGH